MDFTYKSYEYLLELLKERKYEFKDFTNYQGLKRCVILRHDVDYSLQKALELARIENSENVKSTYFVLLSTSFYNVFFKNSFEIIKEIKTLGHDIGLHFDAKKYEIPDVESLEYWVDKESYMLAESIDMEVKSVSMHIPSKFILENDINFKRMINTYSNCFFKEFKYLSDSSMLWREDVLHIISKESYDRLHILTHPFWYSINNESMKEKLTNFIKSSTIERYNNIRDEFKGIEDILSINDLK